MTPDTELTPQQRFMRDMPEVYERYILIAADTNKNFWIKLRKNLCLTRKNRFANDFSLQKHYLLYRAIYMWRELIAGSEFTPITEGGLIASLAQMAMDTPPLLSIDTAAKYSAEFLEWRKLYKAEEAYNVVAPTWRQWLCSRKANKLVDDYRRSGDKDIQDTLSKISAAINSLNRQEDDLNADTWTIPMLASQQDEVVERMPLSRDFAKFNASLGGGLGKREHVILLAPTGGGKTVLACQIAVDLALAGRGVILISTEQHPKELFVRFVSNISSKVGARIHFGVIKDGITEEVKRQLTDEQLATVAKAAELLGPNLICGNWTAGRTLADIPEFIEKHKRAFEERGKTLDCIILDWIGGALTERTSDASKKRLLMMEAATAMKNFALQYNVATISMAQTSKDGMDRSKVSEQHFAECKTLHYEATAAFGVSAVRLKAEENGDQDVYDERQHVYCFKSRKGKGRYWSIKRNFDFQRFEGL